MSFNERLIERPTISTYTSRISALRPLHASQSTSPHNIRHDVLLCYRQQSRQAQSVQIKQAVSNATWYKSKYEV